MDELLNQDLNPEAVPTTDELHSTYGKVAESVEIPESQARSNFEGLTEEQDTSESMFDQDLLSSDAAPIVTATDRPIATMLAAVSSGSIYDNPVLKMSKENLALAQQLLDSDKENLLRSQLATQRQMDTLLHIEKLRAQSQELVKNNQIDPRVQEGLTETYQAVLNNNRKRDARVALEYETVERIQDSLNDGDYAEAAIVADLHTNGNAEQRMYSELSKQLIMSQRMEELQAEYKDSGWMRYFANIITSFVPLRSNFDRAGILDDANIYTSAGGIMQFILSGDNLKAQGQSLWDLDPKDFAEAMAKDGPVMRAIRDNAGLFLNDPGAEMAILKNLGYISQDEQLVENVFGAIDPLLLGAGGASKVTRVLTNMGARSVAVDQTARAIMAATEDGADAAKAATGINVSEALSELVPSALSPKSGVSLGQDIISSLRAADELRKSLPDIIGASKFTSPDEILDAYKAAEKELKLQYGDAVKDVKFMEIDPSTGARVEWAGEVAEGTRLHSVEITIGKKSGGGYATEAPAKGSLTKFGIDDGKTFKDASGQWFAKFNIAVREDGFITSPLITPQGNALNYFRSTARVIDPSLGGKALTAGNAANRFNAAVEKSIKLSLKGLSKGEKTGLDQIIRSGQNRAVWYDTPTFTKHYERLTGDLPSDDVIKAYNQYRKISDLTYLFRNDALYAKKYAEGQRAVKFEYGNQAYDGQGIINYNPKKRLVGGIFDTSNNRWLDGKISPDEIGRMADEGYVLIKLDEPFKLPDKRLVHNVMVNKANLRTGEIRRMQLNYSQGGSRAYTANYFAKQTVKDVDGNLSTPRTFIAGKNLNEMKEWVLDMNAAFKLARDGVKDPAKYDDIFKGRAGYMGGDEFVDAVEREILDISNDLEVVAHAELPSAYRGVSDEGLRYVDLEETSLEGYAKSHGQMFYSEKGRHLKDYTGDFAETVDPWETLNRSIQEVGRVTSFTGYKENVLGRFKETYGPFIKTRDLDSVNSLYELAKAPLTEIARSDLKLSRQIRSEQKAIQRILNFETDFEKTAKQYQRATAEWVLGGGQAGSAREKLHDFTYYLAKNNPVNALRSFAFDMKLGLFNIGQFLIQSSTMISATALSPKYGMQGMFSSAPLFAWANMKYSDSVLDVLAKRGVWKSAGFGSEAEFKEYARTLKESGILQVKGNNLAMVNEYGPNRVFGLASKKDALLGAGRIPFYSAEVMNRLVSSRIAWGLTKDKGLKPGTAMFKENYIRLADDYSMNMMSQSAAQFQHGLMSIPTQFWGYGFRMMDALVGKRFTPAQRVRLLVANFGMAGSAGVPFGSLVSGLYEEMTGESTSIENVDGWLDRGMADGMAYALTGADVEIGVKVGTADMLTNIVADIFGVGKYGEKSVADFVGGATGSIFGETFPALYKATLYSISEASGDFQDADISEDLWLDVAREISTLNYAHNAYYAAMDGVYRSKSNTTYAADLPSSTAFFNAMGFQPRQVSDAADLMEKSNEDKVVEEAAKLVTNWRQEAFTTPDKYETNRKKVQAYMSRYDPYMRQQILDRASKIQDRSLYEKLGRQAEEEMLKKKTYEMFEESPANSPIDQAVSDED